MKTHQSLSRGITSLIAVVVMSVAMTTALGIYQLLFSEFLIARDQENSVIAEYAAHSGVECGLYNLYVDDYDPRTNTPGVECFGDTGDIDDPLRSLGLNADGFYEYQYKMNLNSACTIIEFRYEDFPGGLPQPYRDITIRSRGRYPCSSPQVERAVEVVRRQRLP